jgi:hypothetical protein
MRYKYLSERGDHYEYEEGTQGHRASTMTFDAIASNLRQAIIDLRNLLAGPAPINSTPVVSTSKSVKDLAAFHQQKQNQHASQAAVAEARKKVDFFRKWLSLQGVTADKDGNITSSNIQALVVVYDHALAAQGLTQIHFHGGRLFTDATYRNTLDTSKMVTHFSGPGKAIYVLSQSGNLHVASHVVGNRHHSSLLAGGNVACAGELEVVQGNLRWLSNKSGHYRPKIEHLLQVLHQLQKRNVPMIFPLAVVPGNQQFGTVGEFLNHLDLNDEPDYELMKLLTYSSHLTATVLAPKGWRWRDPHEKAGVYVIATNSFVPHKEVRTWLKSQGRQANVEVQSGSGR